MKKRSEAASKTIVGVRKMEHNLTKCQIETRNINVTDVQRPYGVVNKKHITGNDHGQTIFERDRRRKETMVSVSTNSGCVEMTYAVMR